MPIYEYRCGDCHQIFELFFKAMRQDGVEIVCSACGSEEVTKLFSVFAPTSAGSDDISSFSPEGPVCPCGVTGGRCVN